MAIHRINQRSLPLILVGAGLPQIRGLAGNSKSYAERLFRYPDIGALNEQDAIDAIVKPATSENVVFEKPAVDRILELTERYPYFLQQWAYEAWNISASTTISAATVDAATELAIKELDQSFFKVRFDRCTPSEKTYMRALAEFGSGKHRSGDIAEKLQVKASSVAPTRSALIKKGMIYSPSYGDTEFTVPLFAYSDEAGHAFQYEAGRPFRSEAGRRSDLMSAADCLLSQIEVDDVSDVVGGQVSVDFRRASVAFAGCLRPDRCDRHCG